MRNSLADDWLLAFPELAISECGAGIMPGHDFAGTGKVPPWTAGIPSRRAGAIIDPLIVFMWARQVIERIGVTFLSPLLHIMLLWHTALGASEKEDCDREVLPDATVTDVQVDVAL